jgi:hypothetical protein
VGKLANKTHKDRVAEFNSKLEALSEHHDIPKVGYHVFPAYAMPTDTFPGGARIMRRFGSPVRDFISFSFVSILRELLYPTSRRAPTK